jgi:hypothetical protein
MTSLPYHGGGSGEKDEIDRRPFVCNALAKSSRQSEEFGRSGVINGSLGSSTSSCDCSGSLDSKDWRCCQLSDSSHSAVDCETQTFISRGDGCAASPSVQRVANLHHQQKLASKELPDQSESHLDGIRYSSLHVAAEDRTEMDSGPICSVAARYGKEETMQTTGLMNGCDLADSPLTADEGNADGFADFENSDFESGNFWWQTPCRRCWSDSHLVEAVYTKLGSVDCQQPGGETCGEDEFDSRVPGECLLMRRCSFDSCLQQHALSNQLQKRYSIPQSG